MNLACSLDKGPIILIEHAQSLFVDLPIKSHCYAMDPLLDA